MTELEQLERELAWKQANVCIYSYCAPRRYQQKRWFDTGNIGPDIPDVYEDVSQSVRYLELIGKLERHPEWPELVRVLEL